MSIKHVVGLSGGKDSTALALRLKEVYPDRDFTYISTPAGDELPVVFDHLRYMEEMLGSKIIMIKNHTLKDWITEWNALPNFHQRWCTRVLKIQPTIAFFKANQPALNYVGLRADETLREGIYGDEVESVYPFREWGWELRHIVDYLKKRSIKIPKRTNCARCFNQTEGEWYDLWKEHPEIYADAEEQEKAYGKTFRTYKPPEKRKWGTSLEELRGQFEKGMIPKGRGNKTLDMFPEDTIYSSCRACEF